MAIRYSVIEFADCIDERVFADFTTLEDARGWMQDAYDPDEIETLNVRIAREVDGDRVYETGEPLVAARAGECWDGYWGSTGQPGSERHAGDRRLAAANPPAFALGHRGRLAKADIARNRAGYPVAVALRRLSYL